MALKNFIKVLATGLFVGDVAALWPLPSQYVNGSSVLWLSANTTFKYMGPGSTTTGSGPYANLSAASVQAALFPTSTATANAMKQNETSAASTMIVQGAITRALDALWNNTIIPWKFHPRNSNFEPAVNGSSKIYINNVFLQQNQSDPVNVLKPLAGEIDESYTINIGSVQMPTLVDGTVIITAATSIGLLRALETFTQLFYQTTADGSVYTPHAPVWIHDAPKFAHRGLNMDVARSYYGYEDILRTIDGLAWNKMNVLHLHGTDAQSWPIEIPAMPELAAQGAYQQLDTYDPETLAYIQEYGAYRGIQVIIETDMPGHTASIAFSHPELITAFNMQPWANYAAEPASGQLKLNSSAVYSFLDKLWADLLPRVMPYSAYYHTGGDELNVNAYLLDETVKSNDTKVIQPLLQKFVDYNHGQVRTAGMTPVVWEDMLLHWNLTLGEDVVVQTWQTAGAVAQSVAKGFKTIAGNSDSWFLDCGKGQWLDFSQSTAQQYYPFADYCSPVKNWRDMYAYDPLNGVPVNSTQLVIGGEVHIWSEQTDGVNLDDMLWPRTCAAAEVLWSGAKDASGQNRSQILASPRLAEMRENMVMRGIGAGPVQMVYCTQNGTQCSL